MGENKKYFWLKLYNDFFSSKRIKRLRNLAGGDTLTIIYLKMQLKALASDGYLYFDGVMDDFAEELALDIDENPDDVKLTIEYLLRVGLIEASTDGKEWYLTYLKNCIGVETASTRRSRKCRSNKEEQKALQCNTNATPMQQLATKCNTEKEIEIDKEIDIEIDEDTDKERKKKKEPKTAYGEYSHVKLTVPEYERLVNDYGYEKTQKAIKYFDEYIEDKGYKSKSHNMAMRRWVFDAVDEHEQKQAKANGGSYERPVDRFFADQMQEVKERGIF